MCPNSTWTPVTSRHGAFVSRQFDIQQWGLAFLIGLCLAADEGFSEFHYRAGPAPPDRNPPFGGSAPFTFPRSCPGAWVREGGSRSLPFKLATEPLSGRARTRPSRRGTRPRAHSPTRLGSCPAAEIRSAVAVAAEESYLGPMHPSRCPALSSPFLFSSLFVRCSLVIPSPLRFPSLVSVVSLPLSIVEVESTFAFPVPRSVRP